MGRIYWEHCVRIWICVMYLDTIVVGGSYNLFFLFSVDVLKCTYIHIWLVYAYVLNVVKLISIVEMAVGYYRTNK